MRAKSNVSTVFIDLLCIVSFNTNILLSAEAGKQHDDICHAAQHHQCGKNNSEYAGKKLAPVIEIVTAGQFCSLLSQENMLPLM
jgi:hypothetical protein